MSRACRAALLVALVALTGCPELRPIPEGTPFVPDVSSEFNVPDVSSGAVRVRLVNRVNVDIEALVLMEVLGAQVHESHRMVAAGTSTVLVGPDSTDRVRVRGDRLEPSGPIAIAEQVFDLGDRFQPGDTIVVVLADPAPPILVCPADITVDCTSATDPSVTREAVATNDCAERGLEITFSDVQEGSCPIIVRRTWVATDACGLSNSCEQIIRVEDVAPPTLVCEPAVIDAVCGEVDAESLFVTPQVVDDCDDEVALSFVDGPAEGCPAGVTRTWTATDACGNVSTCTQTVRFEDVTPPELFCPEDVTIACTESTDPDNTGHATAIDACDPEPTVAFEDFELRGKLGSPTIMRVWTAEDACGNTASCTQYITVFDDVAPVIECPPDITIDCAESIDPDNTGQATAEDECDPAPSLTFEDFELRGKFGSITIMRVWTAEDASGNKSSCEQHITLFDDMAPVIECPPDITIDCADGHDPDLTGRPIVEDNCDPEPLVTFEDFELRGEPGFTIMRVWTAEDAFGNTSSCEQFITLIDEAPPVITCPPDVSVGCDDSTEPDATGFAMAQDACDPEPFIWYEDVVDPCMPNLIERFWNATDNFGNFATCIQAITIVDEIPPELFCPPDLSLDCELGVSPDLTGTPEVWDDCDPEPFVTFEDTPDPETPGVIVRVWTATDASGNSSSCSQRITQIDDRPPQIECPPTWFAECGISIAPDVTGFATAQDTCDPEPMVYYVDDVPPDSEFTIERNWFAVDASGNVAQCTQFIFVPDQTPPVLICPPDFTTTCRFGPPPLPPPGGDPDVNPPGDGQEDLGGPYDPTLGDALTWPVAYDECDPNPPRITWEDDWKGDCPGVLFRTWYATDWVGNTSSCVQVITLEP